jgi:type I restriction enzyme, S subunit
VQGGLVFTLLEHREKLVGLSQGAAQQNINQGHIKDFQILKPDDSALLKFQNTVLPMLDQIRTLKKQSENLKRTRDLLLPKLISGEH